MFQENSIETCILSRVKQITAIFLVILYFLLNSSFSICSLNTDFLKGSFLASYRGFFVLFLTPVLLKYNWHITFYKFNIYNVVVVVVVVLDSQSCPILYNPTECSSPDSSVHGILQARILEWVAIPSPEVLPDPGFKPRSPALQASSLPFELQGSSNIMM